jgi:Holliday junction resolvase RusA-like endonuclease
MEIDPPTATAQEKQVRVICGHPQFYEKPAAKEAKKLLIAELMKHKPEGPLHGPLRLSVDWFFQKRKADKFIGIKLKDTKPDTDNLQKGLKDCMTKVGFWKDDAQVAVEHVSKWWTSGKTGILITVEELEEPDGGGVNG